MRSPSVQLHYHGAHVEASIGDKIATWVRALMERAWIHIRGPTSIVDGVPHGQDTLSSSPSKAIVGEVPHKQGVLSGMTSEVPAKEGEAAPQIASGAAYSEGAPWKT